MRWALKDAQFEIMRKWEKGFLKEDAAGVKAGPGSTGLSVEQHAWPSRRAHEVEACLGQGVGGKIVKTFEPRPVGVKIVFCGQQGPWNA